jgi:hypothetical protein
MTPLSSPLQHYHILLGTDNFEERVIVFPLFVSFLSIHQWLVMHAVEI